MHPVRCIFIVGLTITLISCAPKTETLGHEAVSAKAPAQHFVFTGSPRLKDLTVEDYAALNNDMHGLLRRSGFSNGKGYLIPTPHFHGGTYPTLTVEGDSDPGVDLTSKESISAVVERFALECEKTLRHSKNQKLPSQPSLEPTAPSD